MNKNQKNPSSPPKGQKKNAKSQQEGKNQIHPLQSDLNMHTQQFDFQVSKKRNTIVYRKKQKKKEENQKEEKGERERERGGKKKRIPSKEKKEEKKRGKIT